MKIDRIYKRTPHQTNKASQAHFAEMIRSSVIDFNAMPHAVCYIVLHVTHVIQLLEVQTYLHF